MEVIPKTRKTPKWAIAISMVLGIPVLIIYVMSIISDSNNSSTSSSKTHTSSVRTAPVAQKKHTLTGTTNKTHKLYFQKGLVIIGLNAQCARTESIAVEFSNGDGSYYEGHIFNVAGKSWSGETSFNIKEAGFYVINVKINGNWTLTIK